MDIGVTVPTIHLAWTQREADHLDVQYCCSLETDRSAILGEVGMTATHDLSHIMMTGQTGIH